MSIARGDIMDSAKNKPKNSRAKIEANNRYKNKTYKRIAIDIKPTEADYIRDTAKKYNLSIAQLILQAVKMFNDNQHE